MMKSSLPQSSSTDTLVVCRPLYYAWFCPIAALMSGGIIAVSFTRPPTSGFWERPFFFALGLLILAGGINAGIYACRFCIIADKNGLRIRDWRPWRFVPWSEVKDYCEQLPSPKDRATHILGFRNIVETSSGDRFNIPADWSQVLRLKMLIEERSHAATKAIKPNGTAGWALQGARPHELPLAFTYDESKFRHRLPIVITIAVLAFVLFAMIPFWFRAGEAAGHHPERATSSFGAGVFLAGMCMVLTGSMTVMIVRELQDSIGRARKGEQFQAGMEGLTVTAKGDQRHVPWRGIIGYEAKVNNLVGGREASWTTIRVRTDWGYEFTFTSHLTNYSLLLYMLRQYAPEAIERRVDRNRIEALGTIADRWTGGEEAKGDRVFHAKIRSNRALLWLPWGICVVMLLMAYLTRRGLVFNENINSSLVPAALFALIGAGMTWCYYGTQVEIGPRGMALNLPWRKTLIAWSNVERWSVDGDTGIIEAHDGTRIRWVPSMLAYGSEIESLLEGYMRDYRAKVAKEAPLQNPR